MPIWSTVASTNCRFSPRQAFAAGTTFPLQCTCDNPRGANELEAEVDELRRRAQTLTLDDRGL